VRVIWPFNEDVFNDGDFLPSSVIDSPYQDNKQKSTILEGSNLKLRLQQTLFDIRLKSSALELEGNEHQISPVHIKTFPKGGVC
jgi:hypothetical protein